MQMPGKKTGNWPIYISVLVITSIAVASCVLLVQISSQRTLQSHIYSEMHTTAAIQAEIIHHEIEDQFKPLKMLADYITDLDSFQNEEGREVLEALKKENNFCALGFADVEGNAINYNGEAIGNIAQRKYFSEIASGETERKVEYLSATNLVEEPRFLFSLPAYKDGVINGVIFASKEVSIVSNVLLNETLFDGSERLYIINEDATVLAANAKATEEMQNRDLSNTFRTILQHSLEGRSSDTFPIDDEAYVTCIPVNINQWQMVCVLEKENAEAIFSNITNSLKEVANIVSILLIAVIIYTVLMTQYRVSRYKKGETQMFNQYSSYRTLLEKLNCAVVEYRVEDDSLNANQLFMEKYAEGEPVNKPITMQRLQSIHPEFNFTELDEAINEAKKTKQPYTFETAVSFTDSKVYWIEITLMPQMSLNGYITDILTAIVDTTKAHESSEHEETISNIPNGIHRCYLSDPIHMEFASKGMCEMLGYTEEELSEKIGPKRLLGNLIHPEDRDKFTRFVHEASSKEGRFHCEYRMQKRDGSFILVFDVMEVKRAVSGVMYGYSSVTDITDFHRAEEIANARLRAAEEEIEKHISRERKAIAEENKRRRKVEDLEKRLRSAQLKNSMSQMQPHFLYNALASIREIVLDDPKYASDLLYDFSTHLRACIRAMSHNDLVPFEQELQNINAYINIEKMRFGEKLQTRFDIADKDFSIVPLSIQPLVENAIRHGIYEKGAAGGTVSLSTKQTETHHVIRVSDDGVGFDYEQIRLEIERQERDSTGLTNLIFRLKKIMNADIKVDTTVGVGTIITVLIPKEWEGKQSENSNC